MVRNKLGHTALGLAVCAVGIGGYQGQWLSPHLAIPFLVVAFLGGAWAWVIGHAGIVIPALLILPPLWAFEQLDPRRPAGARRRAYREGVSAVSMRDVMYYGTELGHHFRYRIDDGGVLRVTDLGEREGWGGHRCEYVFSVGHREALVYDFREDDPEWGRLTCSPGCNAPNQALQQTAGALADSRVQAHRAPAAAELGRSAAEGLRVALFVPGITTCGLCDELVAEDEDRVSTPHFIADEAHPLWPYSDAVIHRRCFRRWRDRRAFVAEYVRAAYPRLTYRLRFLYLWAAVWWWGRTRRCT